jgi:murein DD-endopeptidase MepM/ murein hydrolase activator NlpD
MSKKYITIFIYLSLLVFFLLPRPLFPLEEHRPFIYPIEGEVITSFREECPGPGGSIRRHTGIDIKDEPGTKVAAAANGIVSHTGISPTGELTIVIRHNTRIRTTYLNLAGIYVRSGDKIKQGDCIGYIGAYDDISSDSCHLHFAVIYDNSYLDPVQLLEIDYRSISRFLKLLYVEQDFEIY